MDLMSNKGEYKTKEGSDRREHNNEPRKTWFYQRRRDEPLTRGWASKSQRSVTRDKVKILCQGATHWKTGIFLRGRVELFTGGCGIPKRDDAENEKNDYKTDEGDRKGKYKYLSWSNF